MSGARSGVAGGASNTEAEIQSLASVMRSDLIPAAKALGEMMRDVAEYLSDVRDGAKVLNEFLHNSNGAMPAVPQSFDSRTMLRSAGVNGPVVVNLNISREDLARALEGKGMARLSR